MKKFKLIFKIIKRFTGFFAFRYHHENENIKLTLHAMLATADNYLKLI